MAFTNGSQDALLAAEWALLARLLHFARSLLFARSMSNVQTG
jgi:hypothetical protein